METKTIPLLTAEDIEVKVSQCFEKGIAVLLYKTARTDMNILDKVYGAANWQSDYREIKSNLYCGIGVRTTDNGEWVWKWNCGTESRKDSDGNEKKGEASDAFKRAGTLWGIGRELYTAPFIFINAETVKDGNAWKLKNRYTRYSCSAIEYDDKDCIKSVTIINDKGSVVFGKNAPKPKEEPPAPQAPSTSDTSLPLKERVNNLIDSFPRGKDYDKRTNQNKILAVLELINPEDDKHASEMGKKAGEFIKKYGATKAVDLSETAFASVIGEICEEFL